MKGQDGINPMSEKVSKPDIEIVESIQVFIYPFLSGKTRFQYSINVVSEFQETVFQTMENLFERGAHSDFSG